MSKPNQKSLDDFLNKMPFDLELEQSVLGAILFDKKNLIMIIDLLNKDVFYANYHQDIFEAIHNLYLRGSSVDVMLVVMELKRMGKLNVHEKVTPFYISSLTSKVSNTTNIETHVRLMLELHMKRTSIVLSYKTIQDATNPTNDAFDIVDNLQKDVSNIYDIAVKNVEHTPTKVIGKYLEQVQNAINNKGQILGIPSGIKDLDKMTNGWQNSNLILVGARPAMGKTGWLLTNVRNAILHRKEPVLVFSLEMSAMELMGRLIAMETGISSFQALKGQVDESYFNQSNSFVSSLYDKDKPLLIIDDTPSLSIFDIKVRAKRYYEKYGIKAIFLDYVQLAIRSSASQEQVKRELSIIGKGLKGLAKELNIPIIALSQLNRDVEKTPSKRPELMHLRESGTLEEDADQVLFLYRREYYYKLTQKPEFSEIEYDGKIIPSDGLGEIIIAKYRNGAVGSVLCNFKSVTTEWMDWNEYDSEPKDFTPLKNILNNLPNTSPF
jgi:replicative DNA helicase